MMRSPSKPDALSSGPKNPPTLDSPHSRVAGAFGQRACGEEERRLRTKRIKIGSEKRVQDACSKTRTAEKLAQVMHSQWMPLHFAGRQVDLGEAGRGVLV